MNATHTTEISMSALRQYLRKTYGDRMYRIRSDGSVEAYMTPMTNTDQDGWALAGYETEMRRELAR